MMRMRGFVTGATGFIGQRLVSRLIEKGWDVTALVRNTTHTLPNKVKVIKGDILQPDTFEDSGMGADIVYHLAALISFNYKKKDEMIKVNARGTANILKLARLWGVKCSVVVSSACTIGLSYSPDNVLDENAAYNEALIKRNPYMQSKVMAEQEALAVADKQHVTIVNPTTVYGPGDFRLNSGTLIKKISNSSFLPVPPGGSNVIDVDDVVEGIIMAAEKGNSGKRYILGNENMPFSRIFSDIVEVTGCNPIMFPIPYFIKQPFSIAVDIVGRIINSSFITRQVIEDMFYFKYYSNNLAVRELGWRPIYSFRNSVERAWDFYKRHGIL